MDRLIDQSLRVMKRSPCVQPIQRNANGAGALRLSILRASRPGMQIDQ